MTIGRPSLFTDELWAEILERLSTGESLRSICRDDGMPATSTVRGWVLDKETLSDQYARARGMGLDEHGEAMLEIADQTDDPAKARVQIDARKWIMSKLRPETYGDRMKVENDGPPAPFTVIVKNEGDDEAS